MQETYSHNVSEVLNRLKSMLRVDSDAELCRLINIGTNTLANWKKRNSIDHQLIITVCESHKLDLNAVFANKISATKVAEPATGYTTGAAIPLIPINAMAGFSSGDSQVLSIDAEQYIVPEFKNKADFLIRISGTSMSPKYFNGDIVACKKIPTKTFLQWGKVYIMDTVQGALCKRVLASTKKGNIVCRSENSDLYPDFEISWSEVRNLAIVVGVIRLE